MAVEAVPAARRVARPITADHRIGAAVAVVVETAAQAVRRFSVARVAMRARRAAHAVVAVAASLPAAARQVPAAAAKSA